MTTTKKETAVVHEIIPKHEKISDQEKQKILSDMNISFKDLPKILKDDPAIASMELKSGDVIKVIRKSATATEATFFRGVIDA